MWATTSHTDKGKSDNDPSSSSESVSPATGKVQPFGPSTPSWPPCRASSRSAQTCPILATWDDHDLGANDAGGDYPKKDESQKIFLDFFGDPADSPRRHRPGVYDAKVFGPEGKRVQVILLDTRYFRSSR